MQDLSLSKKNNGMSFKNAVANTGFYVLLCKVRVMLFPNKYVRAPGNLFQQRRQGISIQIFSAGQRSKNKHG